MYMVTPSMFVAAAALSDAGSSAIALCVSTEHDPRALPATLIPDFR